MLVWVKDIVAIYQIIMILNTENINVARLYFQ